MPPQLRRSIGLAFWLYLLVLARPESAPDGSPRFSVTIPPGRSEASIDGRLLLLLSTDASAEPRMQINDSPPVQYAPQYPFFGYGLGGNALLFHHGGHHR